MQPDISLFKKEPISVNLAGEIREKIKYPAYQLYTFYAKYVLVQDVISRFPIPEMVYPGWKPSYKIYVYVNMNGSEIKLKKFSGDELGLKQATTYINLKVEEHIRVEMRMAKELGIEYKSIFNNKE